MQKPLIKRPVSFVILAMATLAAGGCESNVYVYDFRGKVVDGFGQPVVGVPVHVETDPTGNPWSYWGEDGKPIDGWDEKHDPASRTDSAGRFRTEAIGDVYTSWLYPLLAEPAAPPLSKVRVWFGRGDRWWVPAAVTSLAPADQSRIGGANSRGGNNTRHVDLPQSIILPNLATQAVRSPDWHRLDSKQRSESSAPN